MVKITKKHTRTPSRYIKSAVDDELGDKFDDEFDDVDGLMDAVDDVADNIQDLQDSLDDMKQDDIDIALNNNIANHYIAECEKCQNIFISAVIDSTQLVDHVTGVCPVCHEETDQYLKWVIRDVNE